MNAKDPDMELSYEGTVQLRLQTSRCAYIMLPTSKADNRDAVAEFNDSIKPKLYFITAALRY